MFYPLDAVAAGAPLLHPESGGSAGDAVSIGVRPLPDTNVCHRFRLISGDADAGLDGADVVVEQTYRTAGARPAAMEPHATLARFEADRLELITGTQTPFNLRADLAGLFGIDEERIRIQAPPMGGSFGPRPSPALRRSPPAWPARPAGRSRRCSSARRSG